MRKPDPNIKLRRAIKVAKDYTDESEKKVKKYSDESVEESRKYTDEKISEVIERIPEPVEIPELDMDEVAAGVIARMPKPGKKRKKKKELELAEVMTIVTDAVAGIQTEYKKTGDTIIVQQAPQTIIKKIKEVTTGRIDYDSIHKYIDQKMEPLRVPIKAYGGPSTIRGLVDVNLDGVQTDEQGNYLLGELPEGDIGVSFETVNKNLSAYPNVLNYTGDDLTSIVYTTSNGIITKTLAYSGANLISIVLSGDLPSKLVETTKTLSYVGDNLKNITYS